MLITLIQCCTASDRNVWFAVVGLRSNAPQSDSLPSGPCWSGSCGGSKPAGGGGGLGWLGGGGLGQEFISLLIGPFDHFFQFVLEFFCKRSMTREKNAGLFIFALIREFGGGEG